MTSSLPSLEELAAEYRHLREEHRRASEDGRVRRRLERRLQGVANRYERRLRSVGDEGVREEWRRHLYDGAAVPSELPLRAGRPAAPAAPEPRIEIVARGRVGERARGDLRAALARIVARSPRPIVFVRGSLRRDPDGAVGSPAHAGAVVGTGGHVFRAEASGRTAMDAIDLMIRQLHRELREQRRRETAARRRPAEAPPGEWRHGWR